MTEMDDAGILILPFGGGRGSPNAGVEFPVEVAVLVSRLLESAVLTEDEADADEGAKEAAVKLLLLLLVLLEAPPASLL